MKQIITQTINVLSSKERRTVWALTVCNLVISLLDIASLALLVFIVGIYTGQVATTSFSNLPGWVTDKSSLALIFSFLLFFLVKNIGGYLISQFQFRFVYTVASRISKEQLSKFLEGSYNDYVEIDSAVLIRRIIHQPIEFCYYVLAGLQQIFTELVLSFFTIVAILLFDARLFLLVSLLLLPPILIIALFTKRKLRSARENIKSSSELSLQHLKEALAGFVESNIYDKNSFFTNRYAQYQERLNSYLSQLQSTQSISSSLIEIFAVLGLTALVAISHYGNLGVTNIISIGAFTAAAYKLIPGLVKVSNLGGQVKTYSFTLDGLKAEVASKGETPKDKLEINSVDVKDLHFSYDDSKLIDGLNFSLKSGDFAIIKGRSGTGKTSVLHLLLGLLQMKKGEIAINGGTTETRELPNWWNNIAYVKQQIFLIHDTVEENITMGTEPDMERLNNVCKLTGVDDMLKELGRETIIKENGKNISGGQRQRIAFARALYKDAGLVILDEPFNELDAASEKTMLEELKQMAAQGKIILLITHNEDADRYCNKIITINNEG